MAGAIILPFSPMPAPFSKRALKLFNLLDEFLAPRSVPACLGVETELRYFSPLKKLKRELDFKSAQDLQIDQHYFSEEFISLVSWFVFRAMGMTEIWREEEITRCRIRRTIHQSGSVICSLELKGPKKDFQRREIIIPVSEDLFKRLRVFTNGSHVRKQRFEFDGIAGRNSPFHLHVDILKIAGAAASKRRKPSRIDGIEFALMEVEVSDRKTIPLIMNGTHSIPAIQSAIPVWTHSAHIRKPLASWRLAHRGFTKKTERAIKFLSRLSR